MPHLRSASVIAEIAVEFGEWLLRASKMLGASSS